MSYINAISTKNHVLVWERHNHRKRTPVKYQLDYYCYFKDEHGSYTSIFNDKLSKKTFRNRYEMSDWLKTNKNNLKFDRGGLELFESDISTEIRTLSTNYYDVKAPALNVTFLDIEVDYDRAIGYSSVSNPYAPINAIALYHNWTNRMVVYAVPPQHYSGDPVDLTNDGLYKKMEEISPFPTDTINQVTICNNERELLHYFLWEIENSDLLSGWNCIPTTQSVWLKSEITPISNALAGMELISSCIKRKFPTTSKKLHRMQLSNGMTIESSKDHVFPTISVPHHTNPDLTNHTSDNTVETLINTPNLSHFVELHIRDNDNIDVTDESHRDLFLLGCVYTINEYSIRLNLTKLSQLSYLQFSSFLSGLLDSVGYVHNNAIELCIDNDDIGPLSELCLWNGIVTTSNNNILRLEHVDYDKLILRDQPQWKKLKTTQLEQQSQRADKINFRIVDDKCYVRITNITATDVLVDMTDIETTSHYFHTKGIRCHNSDWFDMPYIAKRLMMLDDTSESDLMDGIVSKLFSKLSFSEAPQPTWRTVDRFGTAGHQTIDLGGRISLDYLDLFRKYEMAERPSYKLESISDEILPNLPKLEYEGSLAGLYVSNFPKFCRYNFRDTEILKGFEDTLGYVELANQIVHLSTGLFKHVGGTLKLAELATINHCHHQLNKIVNDVHPDDSGDTIKGAFVLIPQVGMHHGTGSVDIKSLYPSAIRSLNISPEMLIGQFTGNVKDSEEIAKSSDAMLTLKTDAGEELQMSAKQWRSVLTAEKWAVSGFGTVFDQTDKGIIPTILETWYATRKTYQRQMVDAKTKMSELAASYDDDNTASAIAKMSKKDAVIYEKLNKLQAHFNRLQYVYKIKLNSFYGALTNAYFRFYDLRMGESTTGTGRAILIHQCAQTIKEITGTYTLPDRVCIKHKKGPHKGEYTPATPEQIADPEQSIHYGYSDKYPIIYGDTDSTYFATGYTDDEQATKRADEIGKLVNLSFPEYMRNTFMCNPEYDEIIQTEREIVSDRGIFVDKKRYILHIINDDGFKVDKIKVMGLETKKSTMSKHIAKELNSFIERLLKGEKWCTIQQDVVDFKEQLIDKIGSDTMALGLMKGIKKLEAYTETYHEDPKCFLPGHVSAAIHFNELLITYKDTETLSIKSGDKIKVFYLTQPYKRFKAIAISSDIETLPTWFIDDYVPFIDINAHIERLIDKPLNNILKAIELSTPSKQSMFADSILEF